eukprot:jgi/Tetstr1/425338/TSEL_015787.t1
METIMGVRHPTKKGYYMLSFDLQDGFYALGIAPSDRDYFTVNIRGEFYRLCGLPMWLSLSSYYFVTFTMTFPETPELRQRAADMLDVLGLQRNPTKGLWKPLV